MESKLFLKAILLIFHMSLPNAVLSVDDAVLKCRWVGWLVFRGYVPTGPVVGRRVSRPHGVPAAPPSLCPTVPSPLLLHRPVLPHSSQLTHSSVPRRRPSLADSVTQSLSPLIAGHSDDV